MTVAPNLVDLRSDTVTRPSNAMRHAMVTAEVGDDVYGEDPTINALQEKVAALFGAGAALFVPSGTMANQVAIRAHTQPGDEVIVDGGGHSFNFETGATAALAGVQVRPIETTRGIYTAAELEAAIRPGDDHYPRTSLCILENTSNFGGGTVWPLDEFDAVIDQAHARNLRVHIDGARLMNAVVASGVAPDRWFSTADSVSLCLSKGLGAPVGSVLAGSQGFISQCHRFRKMFGGGMRQAGILAAAGIYALDHHVERLAEDHARARALAEGLAQSDAIFVDPSLIDTNIVFFDVQADAGAIVRRMAEAQVLASATGPHRMRVVTHLHITDEDVERSIEVIIAAATA